MDKYTTAAVRHLWTAHGIAYKPIIAIVAAMAEDEELSFENALQWWAEWKAQGESYAWPATRWKSEIAYRLLKVNAKCSGGIGLWMDARAREVREIANRVCS